MSSNIIKEITLILIELLTYLFNKYISEGVFLNGFKKSKVVPMHNRIITMALGIITLFQK